VHHSQEANQLSVVIRRLKAAAPDGAVALTFDNSDLMSGKLNSMMCLHTQAGAAASLSADTPVVPEN